MTLSPACRVSNPRRRWSSSISWSGLNKVLAKIQEALGGSIRSIIHHHDLTRFGYLEQSDGEVAALTSPEDIKRQMKVAIYNFQASPYKVILSPFHCSPELCRAEANREDGQANKGFDEHAKVGNFFNDSLISLEGVAWKTSLGTDPTPERKGVNSSFNDQQFLKIVDNFKSTFTQTNHGCLTNCLADMSSKGQDGGIKCLHGRFTNTPPSPLPKLLM